MGKDFNEVFKIDPKFVALTIIFIAICAIVPISSLFDVLYYQNSDLTELVGSVQRPKWQIYLVGWATFLLFSFYAFRNLKLFFRGYVFKLNEHALYFDGVEIAKDDIRSVNYGSWTLTSSPGWIATVQTSESTFNIPTFLTTRGRLRFNAVFSAKILSD
jgi:hypothetical protein